MATTFDDKKIIYTMDRVSRTYGTKTVLKDISISYYYGAKIGVIGENGSGKSSLMKIFAGLKLNVKNANIEPARIKAIRAMIGCAGVIATATRASATELTVITEPASPSTPSIKLTAFVTPTIHNIVIG